MQCQETRSLYSSDTGVACVEFMLEMKTCITVGPGLSPRGLLSCRITSPSHLQPLILLISLNLLQGDIAEQYCRAETSLVQPESSTPGFHVLGNTSAAWQAIQQARSLAVGPTWHVYFSRSARSRLKSREAFSKPDHDWWVPYQCESLIIRSLH